MSIELLWMLSICNRCVKGAFVERIDGVGIRSRNWSCMVRGVLVSWFSNTPLDTQVGSELLEEGTGKYCDAGR